MLRTVDFLVDELKVCGTRTEAEQRVFFVSAKEVLQARINEFKGLPMNSNFLIKVLSSFHFILPNPFLF